MSDQRIEELGDDLAVPRTNGELVFEAPWEGRVFGMAVALNDQGVYPWRDFRDQLVERYVERTGRDVTHIGYYEVLGVFKLAVIIQQIYSRFHRGQTQDERFRHFGARANALTRVAAKLAEKHA